MRSHPWLQRNVYKTSYECSIQPYPIGANGAQNCPRLHIKMGFKRVQRLNKSLRQRFLQEEATILQNQKPLRRPVPSHRLGSAELVRLFFVATSHRQSAFTGRRPRFPRKRSCHENRSHWCRWQSWRRWSPGETRSSAWSGWERQITQAWFPGAASPGAQKHTESLTICSRLGLGESCNHRQQSN